MKTRQFFLCASARIRSNQPLSMKFTKWTALRLIALCLTVTIVWCVAYDRSPSNWSVPVDYQEDSLMVMGWVKAAAEGDFPMFLSKEVHRLGAPYTANWNDWPVW